MSADVVSTAAPPLEVEGLYASYPRRRAGVLQVIAGVSMSIPGGSVTALMGPNGCGKTTLLRVLAGLHAPDSGRIRVGGGGRRIVLMPQRDLLLPWRTIAGNARLGCELQGVDIPPSVLRRELADYGLEGFGTAYPCELSVGMRQRVALLRTLLAFPDCVLMDEPFSAIDRPSSRLLSDRVWEWIRAGNRGCVLVTHDPDEAAALADQIVLLSERPARVVDVITVRCSSDTINMPPSVFRRTVHVGLALGRLEAWEERLRGA